MSSSSRKFGCAIGALALAAMAAPAQAGTTYSFTNITGNSATNAAAGEAQLMVEVQSFAETLDLADGSMGVATSGVSFRFYVEAGDTMSITQIYFEDGALLDLVAIADDDDNTSFWNGVGMVDYSKETDAGNLPGGNMIGFTELAGFHADPDPPTAPNGVETGGEEVLIFWTLQGGQTVDDVNDFLENGGLRIGIHVQAFGDEGSESFVTCTNGDCEPDDPGEVIPLPSAAGMGLVGMGLVMTRRRRS